MRPIIQHGRCDPASGTTFVLGETTVSCSASDSSGNSDTETFKVSVVYHWAGFFSPVNNPEVLNLVKAGSAIPVKLSVGGNMDFGVFTRRPTAPATRGAGLWRVTPRIPSTP